jgi:ABC-type polysaccharide/polyol phosphate transport system ATPase subunit
MSSQPPPIICVESVWKRFSLRLKQVSLRHEALHVFKNLLIKDKDQIASTKNDHILWALQDVSFKVYRGETIGIIGKNGAGKTTLLRLLANILSPTRGSIEVHGRFTALISVGAGFIQTMTGRENIYLNAAMYDVRPAQVEKILDEIIAFADIGQFIDAPVKDYSSGMYARLGFSIAIHIFPDIVFVDEILSVGDKEFRAKCDQKIMELQKENRTFVIVSHSENDIKRLCNRVLVLHQGSLIADTLPAEALEIYHAL